MVASSSRSRRATSGPSPEAFTRDLLAWYATHGRELPWRRTRDPYAIWISEVMLQQTQVSRVAESFFPQFLDRFPTVTSLAQAEWEDVYPLWNGLGYYRRGKNILKAAKLIEQKFSGTMPQDVVVLQGLPGIGAYTSAAIMSFAHDAPLPAIDTNIQRIINVLWPGTNVATKAAELLSFAPSSRDWNNAMMDLATVVRSKADLQSPMAEYFPDAVREQMRPRRKKSTSGTKKTKGKGRRHLIQVGIACIHVHGRYLIQTRPEGKTFTGQWEFPGGKREKGETMRACVKREVQEELGIDVSVRPPFCVTIHHFDRVQLELHFHRCQIQQGRPEAKEGQELDWIAPKDFDQRNFLRTNKEALDKLAKMKFPTQ